MISQDIHYKSYTIPHGTTLIANVYATHRDASSYGPDAHLLAVSMLVMQVTMVLWAMDVEGGRDEEGGWVEIDSEGCIDDGLVV